MSITLGQGWQPKQAVTNSPAPLDPWDRLLLEVMLLREQLLTLPAPTVHVEPQDLSDVVQAVQQLAGPTSQLTAADIASAVREVLVPAPVQESTPEWMERLLEALEKLDFRMKSNGVVSGGGSAGSVTVNNGASAPVPVSIVAGGSSGGLTDAELRATPVAVSGPLTDAQMRASAVPVSGTVNVGNLPATQPVSGPLTDAQLRASAVNVSDQYANGEVLADQNGAGAVLTFTFANPMDLIWVRDTGSVTANVSRVDPYGGTPAASTGIPLPNNEPIPITRTTNSVKVYAPTGAVISCWGYRK